MSKNHASHRGIGHIGGALVALAPLLFLTGEVQASKSVGEPSALIKAQSTSEPLPPAPDDEDLVNISPLLDPAPELFDGKGVATWDGRRTLRGVWVAHPLAQSARRVRIYNLSNGAVVDGALFKRDTGGGDTSVIISSDAAAQLGMDPKKAVNLRIVAVRPAQRPVSDKAVAEASRTPKPDDKDPAPTADAATKPKAKDDTAEAASPVTPPVPAVRPDAEPAAGPTDKPSAESAKVADVEEKALPIDPVDAARREKEPTDGGDFRFVAAADEAAKTATTDGFFKPAPTNEVASEKPDEPTAPIRTLTLATEEEKRVAAGGPVTRRIPDAEASGFVLAPETTRAVKAEEDTKPDAVAKAPDASDDVETKLAVADTRTPPIPAARRPKLADDRTFKFKPDDPPVSSAKADQDRASSETKTEEPAKVSAFKISPEDALGLPRPKGAQDTGDAALGAVNKAPDAPPSLPVSAKAAEKSADGSDASAPKSAETADGSTSDSAKPAATVSEAATFKLAEAEDAKPVKVTDAVEKSAAKAEEKAVLPDTPAFKLASDAETPKVREAAPMKTAALSTPKTAEATRTFKLETKGDESPKTEVAAVDARASESSLRRPYIQAGLFGVPENAEKLIARLKARGIPAASKPLVSKGRQFARVIAGPFADRAARDKAQKLIRGMGLRDAVPVRR